MTYHEIEACVIRAKNGSQEDLLKIFQQYKYFILKTAKDFNIRNHDVYDLLQIGYITLIKAVNKYKIGYHCFSNYAYTSVKNAFRYTARQNSKLSDEISLYAPAEFDGSLDAEYMDFLAVDEDLEEKIVNSENIEEVRKAISKLSEEEMELVIMVYYSGATLKTYAEKKGFAYPEALKLRNNIFKRLTRYLKM